MKYLTLCQSVLLAISLAFVSTLAIARDRDDGAASGNKGQRNCANCPRPKKYDSQEVIRRTKEVDHTRTVNTKKVIPSRRVRETNHLVVHENETRNVGTVQHNRTIIEKEVVLTRQNVDHKYVNKVVDLVQHKYHTERRRIVEEREVPGRVRYLGGCNCDRRGRAHGMATHRAHKTAQRSMRPSYAERRYMEPRSMRPRYTEQRYVEPRSMRPRYTEQRYMEPRYVGPRYYYYY